METADAGDHLIGEPLPEDGNDRAEPPEAVTEIPATEEAAVAEAKAAYDARVKNADKLLSSQDKEDWLKACNILKEAQKYKDTPEIQNKIKEAQEKYKRSTVR